MDIFHVIITRWALYFLKVGESIIDTPITRCVYDRFHTPQLEFPSGDK